MEVIIQARHVPGHTVAPWIFRLPDATVRMNLTLPKLLVLGAHRVGKGRYRFKVDKVVYEARVISCLPKWEQVFYEDVKDVELMDVLSYSCLDPIRKLERKAKDL